MLNALHTSLPRIIAANGGFSLDKLRFEALAPIPAGVYMFRAVDERSGAETTIRVRVVHSKGTILIALL